MARFIDTATSTKQNYFTLSQRVFVNQFMIPGVSNGSAMAKPDPSADSSGTPLRREDTTRKLSERKLIIVMVGLPARGKSFTARKLNRYLNWMGFSSLVFNFGQYRRKSMEGFQSSDFFSSENSQGTKLRFVLDVWKVFLSHSIALMQRPVCFHGNG